MKKSQLKQLIKPIVKECILESLIEEGVLSNIISEVMRGTQSSRTPLTENHDLQQEQQLKEQREVQLREKQQRLLEQRRKILDAVNVDAFGGVDLFEGTTPMASAGNPDAGPQASGPLTGVDPNDPGVDISSLVGMTNTWKAMVK